MFIMPLCYLYGVSATFFFCITQINLYFPNKKIIVSAFAVGKFIVVPRVYEVPLIQWS